ncbi:MAG: hypothetical protein SAJ37_02305 [Oscillatoria sp. PMC 1068.18]|nr:hypothetical protein [Oscillatoria sp. PMC 1076.18]MEC4987555.1 hypothetical protein [Oscillatoria sp. PMC 1068.18]
MNTKLIESLVQIIQSLSLEEKKVLQKKLNLPNYSHEKQSNEKQNSGRKNTSFEPSLEEYIQITRDERIAQQDELLRNCFGDKNN